MKNLKIAESSQQIDVHYNSDLSRLRKEFWQQKMADRFQVEWALIEDSNIQDWIKNHRDFDAILFSEEISETFLKALREIPTEVKNILVADCVVKELGHYIPRILVKDALSTLIPERNASLNSRGTVYVTGDGAALRPAVATAVQLGFSKVNLVASDVDRALEHAEFLRKKFFGINFLLIQDTELTLQPCNGDLLINTVAAAEAESFLEAISYMNFLKKDGLVVDLPFSLQPNLLVQESKTVGVPHVLSFEIQALKDYEMLHKMGVPELPAKTDYLSLWSEFLNQDKGPVT